VDYLHEAKEIAAGGRSLDQERAQTYAQIALVEAVQDVARWLRLINSKVAKLSSGLQQAGDSTGEE
jgi:hypothetical protein